VNQARICADCGRPVSTYDRDCAGCGVAFAGAPARADHSRALQGFEYHLVQGLGWGLGLALAGGVVTLIFYGLVALFYTARGEGRSTCRRARSSPNTGGRVMRK
jgi:hypothetical protein